MFKGSSPTCSRPRDGVTCRVTVSRRRSAPGHDFWPGLPRWVSIRGVFLSLLPWRPIGSWARGRTRRASKQIRAALSFAYKHWDLKNPFAKIEPPLHKEPQIRYLLLSDIGRLFAYLKVQGYGSALAFHLANALFQTACRFEELIQLTWSDCQRVGEEIVALRIRGSVFQDVRVPGTLQ